MSTILAIVENRDGAIKKAGFELISQAKKLGQQTGSDVTALVIGPGITEAAAELGAYGAAKALVLDDQSVAGYHPDIYKQAVIAAFEKSAVKLILFTASPMGKDLAPRIAAKLNAGMASDCIAIEAQDGNIIVEHPIFAGKIFAKLTLKSDIKVISLRPNVFEATILQGGVKAEIQKLPVPAVNLSITVKQTKKSGGDKLDVSDADIIVTGGRGVNSAEGFRVIEDLAASLGAAVGATRAVVDSGWRPHEEQVGQTGKVVSPNLYIMCGASGSIQHWAGMSGSKCIVAVNKDPNAPIFQRADYGIVGDLFEVLPALTNEIKKIRG